jgi:hypothetical protein
LFEIDRAAEGDADKFGSLFEKYVTNVVKQNPWILRSSWWKKYGNEWWRWWNDIVKHGLE